MKQIVFYSWQSDLPNACNRGFIQSALENAAAAIKADDTVEIEPVVDRDTQGVPGAPDIASTIFAKITAADVFVADVSIIGRADKRATPNPNVLIELGYALKALGHGRVILVFNRAFGKIEELPFDLKMRRVLAYEMPAENKERAPERKALESQLDAAIRAALGTIRQQLPPSIPAISAIETQQPNRIIVLRRNLDEIFKKLDQLQPKKHSEGGTADELIGALDLTQESVAEFSKIAEIVAIMNDTDTALEIHRWFVRYLERYDLPEGFAGRFSDADFDYFKFLGHELFVTFITFLLRERRWNILDNVLAEPIAVRYLRREHGPGTVDWKFISQHLLSLIDESSRRRRISLHADLLKERHTTGGLAAIMPMDDFMAADYFLFLVGEISPDTIPFPLEWRPWSALYLKRPPMFFRNAESRRLANKLMELCHVVSFEEFRKRLAERTPLLERLFQSGFWRSPLGAEDIKRFGTR
jgi:hypothetical protein